MNGQQKLTQNKYRKVLTRMHSNKNIFRTSKRTTKKTNEKIRTEMTLTLSDLGCTNALPNVNATNWALYDGQNKRYIGYRSHHSRQVASITKIMTVIVSIELMNHYHLKKELLVTISKSSASMIGTSARLVQGKFIKLYDLLYGALLPSGNDAAYLLSETLGLILFYQAKKLSIEYDSIKSIDPASYDRTIPFVNCFLKEMNAKAAKLKMDQTNYANPHGLVNNLNQSSAHDTLLLSRYACKNQQFRKIMRTRQFTTELKGDKGEEYHRVWRNTNQLLEKGWEGLKTGQTLSAGSCLASLRDDIFIVTLNSDTIASRFKDTETLYNWYQSITI